MKATKIQYWWSGSIPSNALLWDDGSPVLWDDGTFVLWV